MPGLTVHQKKRKATKEALITALEINGTEEKYNLDQVDYYMSYFDDIHMIEELLKTPEKVNVGDLIREKRLLAKEMRSILTFLGLKPSTEGGGGVEDL